MVFQSLSRHCLSLLRCLLTNVNKWTGELLVRPIGSLRCLSLSHTHLSFIVFLYSLFPVVSVTPVTDKTSLVRFAPSKTHVASKVHRWLKDYGAHEFKSIEYLPTPSTGGGVKVRLVGIEKTQVALQVLKTLSPLGGGQFQVHWQPQEIASQHISELTTSDNDNDNIDTYTGSRDAPFKNRCNDLLARYIAQHCAHLPQVRVLLLDAIDHKTTTRLRQESSLMKQQRLHITLVNHHPHIIQALRRKNWRQVRLLQGDLSTLLRTHRVELQQHNVYYFDLQGTAPSMLETLKATSWSEQKSQLQPKWVAGTILCQRAPTELSLTHQAWEIPTDPAHVRLSFLQDVQDLFRTSRYGVKLCLSDAVTSPGWWFFILHFYVHNKKP